MEDQISEIWAKTDQNGVEKAIFLPDKPRFPPETISSYWYGLVFYSQGSGWVLDGCSSKEYLCTLIIIFSRKITMLCWIEFNSHLGIPAIVQRESAAIYFDWVCGDSSKGPQQRFGRTSALLLASLVYNHQMLVPSIYL